MRKELSSAKIEFAVFYSIQKCCPLVVATGDYGSSGSFAVASKNAIGSRGDFNTITLDSAVAGFAPLDMR